MTVVAVLSIVFGVGHLLSGEWVPAAISLIALTLAIERMLHFRAEQASD